MHCLKGTLEQQQLGVFHYCQAPFPLEQLADYKICWSWWERMTAEPYYLLLLLPQKWVEPSNGKKGNELTFIKVFYLQLFC